MPCFDVNAVELLDLVEPHRVLEVPADQNTGLRYSSEADVEHIVPEPRIEYAMRLVVLKQSERVLGDKKGFSQGSELGA